MKTSVLLEQEPVADGGWIVRALLRIEGEAPAADARAAVNLALVLDRSGSMHGDKLEAAREATLHLLRRLAPADVVSVVAYDDRVSTVAPARALRDAPDLFTQVRAIETGGSTNLSGGWLRGREQVAGARTDQRINRVILLTDGLANAGITDRDTLAELTATARENGVTTSTIGFGTDYDEALLRAMAEHGGGESYYIETPDQAPTVFAHEIEGLLGVAAQNLVVTISPIAANLVTVLHSYPVTQHGTDLQLDLGDLYATEPKSVLVELLIDAPETTAELVVAKVVATGVVLNADGSVEQRSVEMAITVSLADGPKVDTQVRREALLLEAARAREAALEAQQRGDIATARSALLRASMNLKAAPFGDVDLQADAADLDALIARYETGAADAADAKYLYQRSVDAKRGAWRKSQIIDRKNRPS